MKNKAGLRKLSIVLLLVLLASVFGTAVYARTDKTSVDVYRIDATFIILKITFPNDISGNFAGEMAGKHFDCLTIPPNILICIGRFRVGSDPSFLTIYDKDTDAIILQTVITSPPNNKGGGDEPPATPAPTQSQDDTCTECG
jgi:hypothetical protein